MENTQNQQDHPTSTDETKVIGNYLISALDMEDEISNSVFCDYMDADNWPAELKPDIFQKIREYLTVLIEDTRKHRKIILGFIQKYGRDKQSQ